jgi:hypothetical protein
VFRLREVRAGATHVFRTGRGTLVLEVRADPALRNHCSLTHTLSAAAIRGYFFFPCQLEAEGLLCLLYAGDGEHR